jgi:hypothetical protein
MVVREMLMRPLTPVGQPHFFKCWLVSKQGHSMRVATQHQTVYNQRRWVQLRPSTHQIIVVIHKRHKRHKRRTNDAHTTQAEWHIMQLDRFLETGPQAFAHKGLYNPARRMPLSEVLREPTIRAHLLSRLPHSLLFGRVGGGGSSELTLQRPSPPPASRPDARAPEREEDGELEELVRALDLPTQMFDHHRHRALGSNAPTPASLAERWMRW